MIEKPKRECGSCTLCCKLLPVKELRKPANTRCNYQRHTGCRIYKNRPLSCRFWSCRWLTNHEGQAALLPRPDHVHYVIDMIADKILIQDNETKEAIEGDVLQIWVDPAHPDAHQEKHLRDYLQMMAIETGMPALIRNGSRSAFILFAPHFFGEWKEHHSELLLSEQEYKQAAKEALEKKPMEQSNPT